MKLWICDYNGGNEKLIEELGYTQRVETEVRDIVEVLDIAKEFIDRGLNVQISANTDGKPVDVVTLFVCQYIRFSQR